MPVPLPYDQLKLSTRGFPKLMITGPYSKSEKSKISKLPKTNRCTPSIFSHPQLEKSFINVLFQEKSSAMMTRIFNNRPKSVQLDKKSE